MRCSPFCTQIAGRNKCWERQGSGLLAGQLREGEGMKKMVTRDWRICRAGDARSPTFWPTPLQRPRPTTTTTEGSTTAYIVTENIHFAPYIKMSSNVVLRRSLTAAAKRPLFPVQLGACNCQPPHMEAGSTHTDIHPFLTASSLAQYTLSRNPVRRSTSSFAYVPGGRACPSSHTSFPKPPPPPISLLFLLPST